MRRKEALVIFPGENIAATVAQHAEFPGAARAFMAQPPRGVGVFLYHTYDSSFFGSVSVIIKRISWISCTVKFNRDAIENVGIPTSRATVVCRRIDEAYRECTSLPVILLLLHTRRVYRYS